MKVIAYSDIAEAVRKLSVEACCNLGDDVKTALELALCAESDDIGKSIISELLQNLELSRDKARPCCQDTGMAVVFCEVGQDVHIVDGLLEDAINEGVRRAYAEGFLRKSVLTPLTRKNTGDNCPAIIHTRLVAGEGLSITVAPKGFGSENMGALRMLKPSQGREGAVDFIVETVKNSGGNACPPLVVGVGIGGTMEKAAIMAKHALTRDVDSPGESAEARALERELLERINSLGIGPMGMGGNITALAVHVELFETHLAGLPVAVNLQCHAARHKSIEI